MNLLPTPRSKVRELERLNKAVRKADSQVSKWMHARQLAEDQLSLFMLRFPEALALRGEQIKKRREDARTRTGCVDDSRVE